jgi:hypothetical protein
MSPGATREFHQLGGVRLTRHAGVHDGIVARALTLISQTRARHPKQRIEPVDRFADLSHDLHEPVTACDVRNLVGQHDVQPRARPRVCGSGQHDLRIDDPPGDDDGASIAAHQRDPPAQAEYRRDMRHTLRQRRGNGRGCRTEMTQPEQTHHEQ